MNSGLLKAGSSPKSEKELLTRFLYESGLIERRKSQKEPPILLVMKIFMANKDRPLSYEAILRKLPKANDADLRSNVVKVCRKLTDSGLIERTAYVPKGKKRWERAFKFVSFYNAVELARQRADSMISGLNDIGEKLDEE